MTVRDIKSLTDQIQKNMDLGLELSTAILSFEKERKHRGEAYGSISENVKLLQEQYKKD